MQSVFDRFLVLLVVNSLFGQDPVLLHLELYALVEPVVRILESIASAHLLQISTQFGALLLDQILVHILVHYHHLQKCTDALIILLPTHNHVVHPVLHFIHITLLPDANIVRLLLFIVLFLLLVLYILVIHLITPFALSMLFWILDINKNFDLLFIIIMANIFIILLITQ